MGYMTFHNLCWDAEEQSTEEQAIIAWIDSDDMRENFEDLYPGGASGTSKWYENEQDMIRLSRAFPRVLFTLCGAGEEETDLWRSYYQAGMVQHAPAEITYPPFDPRCLTDPENSQQLPVVTQEGPAPLPAGPASNSGINTSRPELAATDTGDDEPSFVSIRETMLEQLDDRTILRLYYGIRYHPLLCNDSDYERPYQDYRAAEAELYNFAAATGIQIPEEEEQLRRCRNILAREIRDGLHLTAGLPHPRANDTLFLDYLDDPRTVSQVSI